MTPAIIPDGSINGEGDQIGSGSTRFDNSRWTCDLELCTVLHNRCRLCREWTTHHDDDADDAESFEQAKVCFHTDEALVSKQVGLEREMRAAREETEALLREIQESEAELAWVTQDEKTIEDRKQLQLQVVGGIHGVGGAPRHSRSAPSEPSQPRKRQRHTHTSSQCRPMTPPFASEPGPLHAGSGSEQEPIYVGSESEGGDDTAP